MVKFKIDKITNPNVDKFKQSDIDIAYEFSKLMHKEFGEFLKGIVLFGSVARKEGPHRNDIDIMVLIDDVSFHLDTGLIEAYRVIVSKLVIKTSRRIPLSRGE